MIHNHIKTTGMSWDCPWQTGTSGHPIYESSFSLIGLILSSVLTFSESLTHSIIGQSLVNVPALGCQG